MTADFVVLGAGVIGASVAYHLAGTGAGVILIDQSGPARAPAATWASAGGLRSQGRDPAEQAISLLASSRWRSLEDELCASLEVRFQGHLHLAESEDECAAVDARIIADAAAHIPIERLDARAISELAPALTPRALLGAFTPGDGQAHPGRTAEAFAAAASRAGAELMFGATAHLTQDGDRITGVRLDHGRTISTGCVVLAAGAWSVAMLDAVGLVMPLRWRGLTMLLSDVAEPLLRPTVTAVRRNLSLKQSPSGQMMLGGGWYGTGVAGKVDASPVAEDIGRQWSGACAVLPAMERLALAQMWSGVEAQTADAKPFIGSTSLPGLYVATGFSNHGFQIAPTIGELVAADLTGGPQQLLAPFRLDRPMPRTAGRAAAFRDEPFRS